MTDHTRNASDAAVADAELMLGINRPGLSEDDFRDLAARVASELKLRVGAELGRGLGDQQLVGFEEWLTVTTIRRSNG